MAGGTKCYKVGIVDGQLTRQVVEHSPKFADSIAGAIAKLRRGEPAIVRFHEYAELERKFTTTGR